MNKTLSFNDSLLSVSQRGSFFPYDGLFYTRPALFKRNKEDAQRDESNVLFHLKKCIERRKRSVNNSLWMSFECKPAESFPLYTIPCFIYGDEVQDDKMRIRH